METRHGGLTRHGETATMGCCGGRGPPPNKSRLGGWLDGWGAPSCRLTHERPRGELWRGRERAWRINWMWRVTPILRFFPQFPSRVVPEASKTMEITAQLPFFWKPAMRGLNSSRGRFRLEALYKSPGGGVAFYATGSRQFGCTFLRYLSPSFPFSSGIQCGRSVCSHRFHRERLRPRCSSQSGVRAPLIYFAVAGRSRETFRVLEPRSSFCPTAVFDMMAFRTAYRFAQSDYQPALSRNFLSANRAGRL